jgi:hypothetical protein
MFYFGSTPSGSVDAIDVIPSESHSIPDLIVLQRKDTEVCLQDLSNYIYCALRSDTNDKKNEHIEQLRTKHTINHPRSYITRPHPSTL